MNTYTKEILDLEKRGFTNFNSFFNKDEIEDVAIEVEKIIKNETEAYSKRNLEYKTKSETMTDIKKKQIEKSYHHSNYERKNTFSSSIVGKSRKLDNFFKKLFSDSKFNFLCEKLVGKNYRIFTLAIRQLDSLSQPLGLHQDNWGQLTFSIPLNDILSKDATTIIIP